LEGLSLEVPAGEVHAIMGPNGAGKSTLSYVLTGREGYDVTDGTVSFNGEDLLDMAPEFLKKAKEVAKELKIKPDMLRRPLNVGFSGGEKKRDALRIVADGVNALRSKDRGMLVITHYQRLLDYIVPDKVHVLAGGKIAATGGADFAKKLEKEGYDAYA